jgi:ATP-dependent Lhr-like helicase
VRPTRVAPISLFLREDAPALLAEASVLAAHDPPAGSTRGRNGGSPHAAAARGHRSVPNNSPDTLNAAVTDGVQSSLTHPAREVLAALQARGASFFADLVRSTRRLPAEVEDGLWELVAAGLVTADGFENLRALLDPKRRRGEGRGRTARPRHAAGRWALLTEVVSLEEHLHHSAGLPENPESAQWDSHRFSRPADSREAAAASQMRKAVTVPARTAAGTQEPFPKPQEPAYDDDADLDADDSQQPPASADLEPSATEPPNRPPATPVEAFARQVLARWGVVFRDILQRETLAPPWRDLLLVLRRMEARGEIRGGRFVEAFRGEQFALPEAVDTLRAVRRAAPAGEEITISPADPLNLIGIILPGPRLSASTAVPIRLRDGILVEQPPPQMLSQIDESAYAKSGAGAAA